MAHKNETIDFFTKNCRKVQNEKEYSIPSIRTDHGGKFDCKLFKIFRDKNDFDHNFSTPRIPQQNGVVEKKNRVLQEMKRIMLSENSLSKYF